MTARAAGFTLLETIVALVVAGLVLALLTQGLTMGERSMRAWHGAIEPDADWEVAEHALRGLIERTDPGVWPEPAGLRGGAETLAFDGDLPDPATGSVFAANLRLAVDKQTLWLLWVPRGHGIPFGPPPSVRRERLLDHVARIEIAYAAREHPGVWRRTWTASTLPDLIRLRIIPLSGHRRWPAIVVHPRREQAEG